jgi:hypothetical protein
MTLIQLKKKLAQIKARRIRRLASNLAKLKGGKHDKGK